MELTSDNVHAVFNSCMFNKHESTENKVIIEGITFKAGFHPDRLNSQKDNVFDMLQCLPLSFRQENGGGMSFLSACNDKNDVQWTGMHSTMEELFILGIGLELVEVLAPREMWGMFPGGMPYLVIK
jgi:hypothetical protein